MRYTLILFSFFIFSLNLFSQVKRISGDTTYWHNHAKWLIREFNSKDLSQSNDEFNFRIQYYGHVIEIRKNKEYVNGELINYTFKEGKEWNTLFNKETLSDSIALEVYKLINISGILDIDSDNMIEGWEKGYDGTTYVFEYADKGNYTFKQYWTPDFQGSLKEAQIINQFLTDISRLLKSKEKYDEFMNSLPKKGCYTNGGLATICFQSYSFSVGYTGSTKLPLGYSVELNMPFVGDKKADLGLMVEHLFDGQGNYDFSPSLLKNCLFIRNKKDLKDLILYTYRSRKHNKVSDGSRSQNHNVLYGINFKTTTIGLGVDFLSGRKTQTGGSFLLNQYLSYPKISLLGKAVIYENQFDYKFGLTKSFRFEKLSFLHTINTSLYYECFAKHGSLGWALTVSL